MIKTRATTGPQRPRWLSAGRPRPVAALAALAVVIAARRIAIADTLSLSAGNSRLRHCQS